MLNSIFKVGAMIIAVAVFSAFTLGTTGTDSKSQELLDALKKVNGGWKKIAAKKDVEYSYIYHDFSKGKDISTERYIFDGEASWAKYPHHNVHVLPGQGGVVKQCLMNGNAKVTLDGNNITDPAAIGGAQFLRTVNFFWFTMMYKLDDPGTHHTYMGQELVNGINYDKISLTYNASEVGKEVNDEYILYFNPKTHLVDQFMFSVPAMGIDKPIIRMELDYEKIEGVYIATNRRSYAPNANGEYSQNGQYTTTNIKFKNGFSSDMMKV